MLDGLRARAAASQLIGLLALIGLAFLIRSRLPVGPMYLLKAALCFAATASIAVTFVSSDTHPFPRFGPANQVTTARAVVVALVAGAIGEPALPLVAATMAAAALAVTMMDGIDGWIARSTGVQSGYGARFDMEVDALLILALAILVWEHGKAGAWVVLSGLIRYAFVVAGGASPKMRRPLPPSRRRQAICVVQIAGLIAALAPIVPQPASELAAGTALLTLCYSFAVDVFWLLSDRREQVA
jgi:phosphatidylglycerophosphate synthase